MTTKDRPSRDQVLAWMRERGATIDEASKVHGVPTGTIKYWLHEARKKGEAPAVGTSNHGQPTSNAPARPPKGTTSAAFLSPDARAKLKASIHLQLDYLSNAENVDQKARDAASRALRNLLDSCPDILTFEERLDGRMGGTGATGSGSLAGRVRAALGITG